MIGNVEAHRINEVPEAVGRWTIARSRVGLEPRRYLGELRELPRECKPGDWCDVVVLDEQGEMRWTFLFVEVEATSSIFVERRKHAPNRSDAPQRPTGSRAREARSQLPVPASTDPQAVSAPANPHPGTAWRAGRRS